MRWNFKPRSLITSFRIWHQIYDAETSRLTTDCMVIETAHFSMIAPAPSQSELHLLCVSAVARELITLYNGSSSSTDPMEPPNMGAMRAKYAKKYNLSAVPRLTDVLAAVPDEWKDRLKGWLKARPVRTASGVAVVAVMCKPHRCPHIAMTGNICV